MSLHAFIEYLKYKWNAKGRHGVHSPFVYDLIDHVLLDHGPISREYIVEYPSLPLHYENMISRLAAYYNYQHIFCLPQPKENVSIVSGADLLLFSETVPLQWISMFDQYFSLLKPQGIVIVSGIHKTAEHSKEWHKLHNDERVKMSIDLYETGLLFFKPEFKEQQHFILKY